MIFYKYTLVLLIPSFMFARQPKPAWGDQTIKTRATPTPELIIKGRQGELIAVAIKKTPNALNLPDAYVATRLNNDLRPVMERNLFSTRYRDDFLAMYNFKGNVFLVTRKFDRKERITSLYSTQIDPVTLQAVDSNAIGQYDAVNRNRQPEFNIKISPDTSHILVFAKAPYTSSTQPEKLYLGVRDHYMNKLWDRVITLPYANKFISIEGFEISNEGEVYVVCKHYDKDVLRERVYENGLPVPSYTYKILMVGKDDDQPREHVVDLPGKFVHTMTLEIHDTIQLLGLYKNKVHGRISGHFREVLDKNAAQTVIHHMQPFPVDGLLQLLSKDDCASTNPGDPGLSDNFKVIGANKRSDGSIDLLTEQNYSYEICDSNSRTTVYVAGDIVVINYKKDGRILYTRIPKSQGENSDALISFKWMNHGDELLFFYIDSEKNVKKDLFKRPDRMFLSRSVFVVAAVNDKGELRRQAVYSHKELDLITALNICAVVDTGMLALYVERERLLGKSRFQFGWLKL